MKATARWLSPMAAALAIAGGAAACLLFASQPPCHGDDNCPAHQFCDLETRSCVDRTAGHDGGVLPQDAGPVDGPAADVVASDRAPVDAARADLAMRDTIGVDLSAPDAGAFDTRQPDSSGCIDEDEDNYGEGCALGPDCDDDDDAVYEGTGCDDWYVLTRHDTCHNGVCRGVYESDLTCLGVSCAACPATGCCSMTCSNPNCDNCGAGCSCYVEFDGNANHDPSLTCEPDSHCTFEATTGRNITTTCDDAVCYQICDGSTGACIMHCLGGSSCILSCRGNETSCLIDGCAQRVCDSETVVCNAPCP